MKIIDKNRNCKYIFLIVFLDFFKKKAFGACPNNQKNKFKL